MPAGWSPGEASCGTVMVNGTTFVSLGPTVTVLCTVIQVPPSSDSRSDGSMLKRPLSVR